MGGATVSPDGPIASFALIDREGRLLDWDSGLEAEFSAAANLIAHGTLFSEIVRAAFRVDGISRVADRQSGTPGDPASTFRYRAAWDRIVLVSETITSNGCVGRIASDVTAGTRTHGSSADEETTLRAPLQLIRGKDGFITLTMTPEINAFYGLPTDNLDILGVWSQLDMTQDERDEMFEKIRKSDADLEALSYDVRIRDARGRRRWARQGLIPTRGPDGTTVWNGYIYDITREKLSEEQGELFRAACLQAFDAVHIYHSDASGRSTYLFLNPAAEAMFGHSLTEVVGRSIDEFIPSDVREKALPLVFDALNRDDGATIELETARRDGSQIWIEVRAKVIQRYPDGSFCWLSMSRNIETRRRLQQALITAKDAAEEASRIKSDFLANMSHEIRTPMNGILGMTGLLLESPLDADQRSYAEAVRQSGELLLRVINDILDISKLEAGKVELETIDFDMTSIVDSTVTLLRPRAVEKGIEIGVFLDPKARRAFRGDPNRLRQVLFNLLGNAIKFTDKGSVSIDVILREEYTEGTARVQFDVKDTGIGMAEDVAQRLFKKFSQADTSITRRYGGTGLGLAIAKQLVELMGGGIEVKSRPGLGSLFRVDVPLQISTASFPDQDYVVSHLKGMRALAVDDIEMNLEIISRQLRSLGMEIYTCKDGFDALAELERAWHRGNPYDVVFLDQMLPGLSGLDIVARIRANTVMAPTKVVLVTSGGPRRGDEDLKNFDRIIDKPIRQGDLVMCLATLIEATPSRDTPPQYSGSTHSSKRALNILLAEDNRINQTYLMAVLAKAGHRAHLAENGREAIEALRKSDYDLVLMDVQMPELDGFQATQQIRQMPPPKGDIPIIALTAHAMLGAREECLAAGMNDYLSKPIESALLLVKLDEIAGAARPQTSSAASALPAVDLDQLRSIREVLNDKVFFEQLEILREDFRVRVDRIGAHLTSGDLSASAREAHNLVSTAGNYGARKLSSLAREIEQACVKQESQIAAARYQELCPVAHDTDEAFAAFQRRSVA